MPGEEGEGDRGGAGAVSDDMSKHVFIYHGREFPFAGRPGDGGLFSHSEKVTEESGSNPVIGTEQIERGRSRHITWNVPAPVVLHINNLYYAQMNQKYRYPVITAVKV